MGNPTNRVYKFMPGKPSLIARPRAGHPASTPVAKAGGPEFKQPKPGTRYESGSSHEQVTRRSHERVASRAFALLVARHGLAVDAAPVKRPLFHQEILRRLGRDVVSPTVLAPVVHELTLAGIHKTGYLPKVTVDSTDVAGPAMLMSPHAVAESVAPKLTPHVGRSARVIPSSAEKIAALVTLAKEISVGSTAAPVLGNIVWAFRMVAISGIGDLAYLAKDMPETPKELRLFYRQFVLARVEPAVSSELYVAFVKHMNEGTTAEAFANIAATLPIDKPVRNTTSSGMTRVTGKPDFVQPNLTRNECLDLLQALAKVVGPAPVKSGPVEAVATQLQALGFRGFEMTLMLFVRYLPDQSDARLKSELTDFINIRLQRVLNPSLFDRFVIMLRSHDYATFENVSKEATDEAIWAIEAAPASSGDTKGGQGHNPQRQQAEDGNES